MEGVVDRGAAAPTAGATAVASAAPLLPSPTSDSSGSPSSGTAGLPPTIFSTSSSSSSTPSPSTRPPSAPSLLPCPPHALQRDSSGDSSSSVPETSISFAGDDTTDSSKPGAIVRVARACGHCKKAKARCDLKRPCDRCVRTGKEDSCVDSVHAKRGRKQGSPGDSLKNARTEPHVGLMTSAMPPQSSHFTFHHAAMGFAMGRLTSPNQSPSEPQRNPAHASVLPVAGGFLSPPARPFPLPPSLHPLQLPQAHAQARPNAPPQVYSATTSATTASPSAMQTSPATSPSQSSASGATVAPQTAAASAGPIMPWPFAGPGGPHMMGYGPPPAGSAPALLQPMAYGPAYSAQVQQWQRGAFAAAASSAASSTASATAKDPAGAPPPMPPPPAPMSMPYPPPYGYMPPHPGMYAMPIPGHHPHMQPPPPHYPPHLHPHGHPQPMYVHQPIAQRQFAAAPPFMPSHPQHLPPPPQQQHQQQHQQQTQQPPPQQQQQPTPTLLSLPLPPHPGPVGPPPTSGPAPASAAPTVASPTPQPSHPSGPAQSPAGTWYIPPRVPSTGMHHPHHSPR